MRDSGRIFTLIELLVVIAVILILLALLLPSLQTGKALAQRVACGGKMRQIATAGFSFMADSSDRGPGYATTASWHTILSRQVFGSSSSAQAGDMAVPRFVVTQYDRDNVGRRLWCPILGSLVTLYPDPGYTRSYAWNYDACNNPNYLKQVSDPQSIDPSYSEYYYGAILSSFKNPSRKVLLQETQKASDVINAFYPFGALTPDASCGYTANAGAYAYRHSNKMGAVCFDGHLEYLRMTDPDYNVQARFFRDY